MHKYNPINNKPISMPWWPTFKTCQMRCKSPPKRSKKYVLTPSRSSMKRTQMNRMRDLQATWINSLKVMINSIIRIWINKRRLKLRDCQLNVKWIIKLLRLLNIIRLLRSNSHWFWIRVGNMMLRRRRRSSWKLFKIIHIWIIDDRIYRLISICLDLIKPTCRLPRVIKPGAPCIWMIAKKNSCGSA